MAASPSYAATVRRECVQISTANTNRDGTGTLGSLFTAGGSGSRVERIAITATVTTTAGMIRLFIDDGTNVRLYKEFPIPAVTPSATVQAFSAEIALTDCLLADGDILKVSTEKAETFNVFAFGGDF